MVQTRLKLKLAHEVTLVLKIKIQTGFEIACFFQRPQHCKFMDCDCIEFDEAPVIFCLTPDGNPPPPLPQNCTK